MIKGLAVITVVDHSTFYRELNKVIGEMQNEKLVVDIQYKPIGTSHSAVVIGRVKE